MHINTDRRESNRSKWNLNKTEKKSNQIEKEKQEIDQWTAQQGNE